MKLSGRMEFLLKNGLKGFVWLVIVLGAYFLFEEVVISHAPDEWVEKLYVKPPLVYLMYCASEFFFGLFPPELFMIWAFKQGDTLNYVLNVAFFAVVSYAMGYLTFIIGRYFYKHESIRFLQRTMLKDSWPLLKKYGLFLIIVAALTPIPWSAVSLLVGSAGYPSMRYLKYALFRLLRFAVYGYIVFQTHQL